MQEVFTLRSDISDFPRETGPDTEYLKSSYFPRESLYYDQYNTPVPQGVSAELPQCLTRFLGNIMGHPAIGGKTMAQFRIELDRPMPYGTAVGMTHILRSLITGLPDAGHGRPDPFSVDSLDWADDLDRRGMQDTTLCFTISIHATGAMATIASLLMCAHGRVQPTMLSFPAIDPHGNYYTAIVTSMDFEKWLQEEHFQRRTKQYKLYQKQVAAEVREGRVRITILHPPGRPLLSQEEATTMVTRVFGDNSGPVLEFLKDFQGYKVDGMSSLRWTAMVRPREAWPIRIGHPTLGKQLYYTYLLDSTYSKKYKLCGSCHQSNCDSKSHWYCKHYKKSQIDPNRHRASGPTRGFTTLQHAEWQDPMVRMHSQFYH